MAQFWLDFDRPDNDILREFVAVGSTNTFSVVDDNGTRALYYYPSGGSSFGAQLWRPAGLNVGNCEIYTRMRATNGSVNFPHGVGARIAAGVNGLASMVGSSTQFVVSRVDAGTATNLGVSSHTHVASNGNYHHRIVRFHGTEFAHVAWDGEIGDRPAGWFFSTEDSTYHEGGIGLIARSRSANRDMWVAALGVGTDGDPAPTGPVDGTAIWLPSMFAGGALAASVLADVDITATAGTASWQGVQAAILADGDIAATAGTTDWQGVQAAILADVDITATAGTTSWQGVQASVLADVDITATAATFDWTGVQASVLADDAISAIAGTASWQGVQAQVDGQVDITATAGTTVWAGIQADVTTDTAIECTVATFEWAGVQASILADDSVSATAGTSSWRGVQAQVDEQVDIAATAGTASWQGVQAAIAETVGASPANAVWQGVQAEIQGAAPITIDATAALASWQGVQATIVVDSAVRGRARRRRGTYGPSYPLPDQPVVEYADPVVAPGRDTFVTMAELVRELTPVAQLGAASADLPPEARRARKNIKALRALAAILKVI